MNMTGAELVAWRRSWDHDGTVYEKDGVRIGSYIGGYEHKPMFRVFSYKNMSGCLHADNGYLGPQPDGKDYYPLVRISPTLSQDSRFNPAVPPQMEIIAAAIIKVWRDFTNC